MSEMFSKELPGFQVAWDATSLSMFQSCPRKYQLALIDGWRPNHKSAPLTFGGMLHAGLEHVDHLLANGTERWEAVRSGVKFLLQSTGTYYLEHIVHGEPVADESGELQYPPATWKREGVWDGQEFEEGVQRLWWEPWPKLDSLRSREQLVRALVWYYDQYQNDPLEPLWLRGKPAIELSFSFNLPFRSAALDAELLWCGHMDKLVKFGTSTLVLERKHTTRTIGSYYFDQYTMSDQILGYVLAGQIVFSTKVDGAVVEATQIAQGFIRVHRSPQYRSEDQMAEWLHNLRYWINLAEHYAKVNFWPMNRASCNDYGGCQFRGVCSLSPALRPGALATHFHQDRWDPLAIRGDTTEGA